MKYERWWFCIIYVIVAVVYGLLMVVLGEEIATKSLLLAILAAILENSLKMDYFRIDYYKDRQKKS